MAIQVGMTREDDLSEYLKVYIESAGVMVIGYIGDGASKTLTSMWQSPFEGDTVGQVAGNVGQKFADLGQTQTDITTKTIMNTALVWEGISPHEISLPVYFKAYSDAKREVNDAIMYLEKMTSAELSEGIAGFGSIPQSCTVNIGRRLILPNCRIKSVSSELDAPRNKLGYMTRNLVQLDISMSQAINRSKIQNLYK